MKSTTETAAPAYYNNENGSLYYFAHLLKLNPWETDILKRVVRCRRKGEFEQDLKKSLFLIDLYIEEHGEPEEDMNVAESYIKKFLDFSGNQQLNSLEEAIVSKIVQCRRSGNFMRDLKEAKNYIQRYLEIYEK